MVFRGNLSPDPSNRPEENFSHSHTVNFMPVISSSDDEEEISYEGYEVLPQEFENITHEDDNDSQESSDEGNETSISTTNAKEMSGFDKATKLELTELWNSSNNSRLTNIDMDSTKEEQIKTAMAGFKLPSTAIPSWAQQIPEEEWKEQLINRVNLLNKVTSV